MICWGWAWEVDVPVRFWMWEHAQGVSFGDKVGWGNVFIHSILMWRKMKFAPTGSSHHICAICLSSFGPPSQI